MYMYVYKNLFIVQSKPKINVHRLLAFLGKRTAYWVKLISITKYLN